LSPNREQDRLEQTERQTTGGFADQKLVVVGGSSGMGRETAAEVVAAGGSAVIIGLDPARVDDTVKTLAKEGPAYGITGDLADRAQVERVRQQLADEHADATLLVNAAGIFIPKPFLEHDGPLYDSYLELDRAIFFLTQTVVRGMVPRYMSGSSPGTSSTRPCTASTGSTRSAGWAPPATSPLPSPSCFPRRPAG
jgi:NAD(P)-dependent dehydrogenase (short-subunit alcohol dehydrogenase family)